MDRLHQIQLQPAPLRQRRDDTRVILLQNELEAAEDCFFISVAAALLQDSTPIIKEIGQFERRNHTRPMVAHC